jgi:hypothetical protein
MKAALRYLIVAAGWCLCVGLLSASAQERKPRKVELAQPVPEGSIELTDLSFEGRAIKLSEKFAGGKDWLKSLKLGFKNTYTKHIVHMEVVLHVEKTGNMQYPLGVSMRFGHRPESPSDSLNARDKVAPNGRVKLSLSEETIDSLERFMRENQVEEIEGVTIYLEFVVFDDDTAWGKGHSMRRDTRNPQQWNVSGVWRDGDILYYRTSRSSGPVTGRGRRAVRAPARRPPPSTPSRTSRSRRSHPPSSR